MTASSARTRWRPQQQRRSERVLFRQEQKRKMETNYGGVVDDRKASNFQYFPLRFCVVLRTKHWSCIPMFHNKHSVKMRHRSMIFLVKSDSNIILTLTSIAFGRLSFPRSTKCVSDGIEYLSFKDRMTNLNKRFWSVLQHRISEKKKITRFCHCSVFAFFAFGQRDKERASERKRKTERKNGTCNRIKWFKTFLKYLVCVCFFCFAPDSLVSCACQQLELSFQTIYCQLQRWKNTQQ